jgi:serpin B
MQVYQVDVSMPKFKFTAQFELNKVLKEMGMRRAFAADEADFSGMATREKLFISDVIHKAFVAVDEKGTEAAAATAVLIAPTASAMPLPRPSATFRADHPFLFLIRDNRTGSILFMGRVVNP